VIDAHHFGQCCLEHLAAKSRSGSNGVVFLPWVFGSLAPAPDPRHRGALLGLSLRTTRADMARAMIEGISMQMRWLADEVDATLGTAFDTIRFVGGGAQSDVWSSIMADVVGRPIEQLDNPRHANARGAAFMAFVSTGQLTVDDLAALVPVRARYEPEATTRALWEERLGVVRELHAALAGPVSRLHS
jgi:xylulokinase